NNKLSGKEGRIEHKGNIYEGPLKDNQMIGKGKLTTKNGGVYQGTFENGIRVGSFKWPNGAFYEGEFTKNLEKDFISGQGQLTINGITHEGIFEGSEDKLTLMGPQSVSAESKNMPIDEKG